MRPLPALAVVVAFGAACSSTDRTTADGTPRGADPGLPGIAARSVPLAQLCEVRAEAICYRRSACEPVGLRSRHGDRARCEADETASCEGSFTELLPALIAAHGLVDYDPLQMGRALADWSRASCAVRGVAPSASEASRGAVPLGGACLVDSVCETGRCDRTGRCGTCVTAEPDPGACPARCPTGSRCACERLDAGRVCRCASSLGIGADCASARELCVEGSRCLDGRDASGASVSRCVRVPELGEACGPSVGLAECAGEARCVLDAEGRGRCTAPALVGTGETCDPARLCPVDHDCIGVCVPRAAPGEACRSTIPANESGPPGLCAEGICQRRVCGPGRDAQQSCRGPSECAASLGCYLWTAGNGVCADRAFVEAQVRDNFLCP